MLPVNTILGTLECLEVFEYFDIPILFLCKNTVGTMYLAICTHDDVETYEWIYLAVSNDRLSAILSKHITLYDAIVNPENECLFKVESDYDGVSTVNYILPGSLQADDLPDKDAFIGYTTPLNVAK